MRVDDVLFQYEPTALLQSFELAAHAGGFTVEPYGVAAGWPLLAFTRPADEDRPRVYLSAGIHGDEQAPPLALLRMLREGLFDDRCSWSICPILNPVGYSGGQRENGEGIDLNRDYRGLVAPETRAHVAWLTSQPSFDLNICVHEDWESAGYYVYELNPDGRAGLAHAMIEAAEALGRIEEAAIIDGHPISERGIIRPVSDPGQRPQWPETIYLRQNHGGLCYTLESASTEAIEDRIEMHCAVIRSALEVFTRRCQRRRREP